MRRRLPVSGVAMDMPGWCSVSAVTSQGGIFTQATTAGFRNLFSLQSGPRCVGLLEKELQVAGWMIINSAVAGLQYGGRVYQTRSQRLPVVVESISDLKGALCRYHKRIRNLSGSILGMQ